MLFCVFNYTLRNLDAAHQLQKELEAATNNGNLRVEHLDLTIPETISEFARSIADSPIHVLINNAGVMCAEPEYVVMGTSEGAVEQNVATNYLGHFYLTHCLLNCLRRTAEEENLVIIPRIIIVSSSLCSKGTVDGLFSADWDTRNWNTTQAYANSKLACSLMARELHRRFGPRSLNVYCVYTGGMVDTNLSRHVLQGYASPTRYLLRLLSRVLLKPPLDGCQSIVHCAVSDNVLTAHCSDAEAAVDDDLTGSGRLYSNCVPIAWPSAAQDPQVARRLWEETVKFLDLDDSS